jgi:poly(hydroxyalkanoate) granule-associated protein
MATKVKKEEILEEPVIEERNPLFEAARKVLLAGIGAIALAQEEIEEFVNRLVERGEIAEKDGRKLISEVMDRRKKDVERTEDEVTKRIESVMDRMSVPSKADIDTLSEKISVLTKKIDELKK